MSKRMHSEALRVQGAAAHWFDPFSWRSRCGSLVGSNSPDRADVTCADCLAGRLALDRVTDVYGRVRRGQLELF